MSTASRRRNGSQASCEPCRKGKTRCDHQKPRCGSCRRRGLESQCWYHPAPLTKRRALVAGASPPSTPATLTTPGRRNDNVSILRDVHVNNAGSSAATPAATESFFTSGRDGAPGRFHAWPFILNESEKHSMPSRPGLDDERAYDEHLSEAEEVVSQLRNFTRVESLLGEYLSFSQVALVPRPIILRFIASIRTIHAAPGGIGQEKEGDEAGIHAVMSDLAKYVLRSSSSDVVITPSLDLEGFCALCCGDKLRIETLGLLYTTAARSYLCGLGHRQGLRDDGFIRDMVRCSNLSLRLARDLATHTNDVVIWLTYENLQLTTLIEGDACLNVWRRLGDLVTDLVALGLHREATYSADTTPFFLAECRRKTFTAVYHLDKLFAAVFSRPPRLSARHADCTLPLDLPDDDIFTVTPEQAKRVLTADGWNTSGGYRSATWARIRYILGRFREETVEYRFRSVHSDVELRAISDRCHRAWEALPSHLQYSQDCWKSNLSPAICLMLGKVYLSYLHINFQLVHMLGQGRTSPQPEIVKLSANMLQTVAQMAQARNKAPFSPRDVPGILLSYGLPSASVLMAALHDAAQHPTSKGLPPGVNGALVIRNLSVLVSQLESISGTSETNHVFCTQAAELIARKLDRILESRFSAGFPAGNGAVPPSSITVGRDSPQSPSSITPIRQSLDSDSGGVGGGAFALSLGDLDNIDIGDLRDCDLETWAMSSDLGMNSAEWNMF